MPGTEEVLNKYLLNEGMNKYILNRIAQMNGKATHRMEETIY